MQAENYLSLSKKNPHSFSAKKYESQNFVNFDRKVLSITNFACPKENLPKNNLNANKYISSGMVSDVGH